MGIRLTYLDIQMYIVELQLFFKNPTVDHDMVSL